MGKKDDEEVDIKGSSKTQFRRTLKKNERTSNNKSRKFSLEMTELKVGSLKMHSEV